MPCLQPPMAPQLLRGVTGHLGAGTRASDMASADVASLGCCPGLHMRWPLLTRYPESTRKPAHPSAPLSWQSPTQPGLWRNPKCQEHAQGLCVGITAYLTCTNQIKETSGKGKEPSPAPTAIHQGASGRQGCGRRPLGSAAGAPSQLGLF